MYSYTRSSDKNNKLENLFLLNSEHDVTNAFKYIESIKNNEKGNFLNDKNTR